MGKKSKGRRTIPWLPQTPAQTLVYPSLFILSFEAVLGAMYPKLKQGTCQSYDGCFSREKWRLRIRRVGRAWCWFGDA